MSQAKCRTHCEVLNKLTTEKAGALSHVFKKVQANGIHIGASSLLRFYSSVDYYLLLRFVATINL